jgi:adenine phosphoribosyltransferase
MTFDLDKAIRKIPDFPKEGILFYDITSILTNAAAYYWCIQQMDLFYGEKKIDAIAAIEARGFLFGAPYAVKKGIPLILIRKKGKLPGKTVQKKFALEYGEDIIEIHQEDIPIGKNVLLVDDLLATGGTMAAAAQLLTESGARVTDIFAVIGLPFLNYEEHLKDYDITTLLDYEGE